jgi:hypothetical protein
MNLEYQRDTLIYEAVMTDLALLGIISAEQCEALTDRKLGTNIKLPKGFEEVVEA